MTNLEELAVELEVVSTMMHEFARRHSYTLATSEHAILSDQVRKEISAIGNRLDHLSFAVRYPEQAVKNGTLK